MALVLPPSFLQNVSQAAGHTARGDRLTIGASFAPGTATLSGRTGILPGPTGGLGEVSLINATTVRVQAFRGVVQGTQDTRQGQYLISNDGPVDLTIGAQASGVTRRDLIVAYVRDSAYTPTTQNDALLTVIPGTPVASNPALPATPINALLLGEVLVAPTGGTNQLTPYNPRTAAAGGIIVVPTNDPTPGTDGQWRETPEGLQRFHGPSGTWRNALGGKVEFLDYPGAVVSPGSSYGFQLASFQAPHIGARMLLVISAGLIYGSAAQQTAQITWLPANPGSGYSYDSSNQRSDFGGIDRISGAPGGGSTVYRCYRFAEIYCTALSVLVNLQLIVGTGGSTVQITDQRTAVMHQRVMV